jgi:branched-subunit amino acid aminotransferase/4-amino-4-deoxychorismate lyase
MQLLEAGLAEAGMPLRRSAVRLADLASFGGAFVTNSLEIVPVTRIDDLSLPVDGELMKTASRVYESVPGT